MTSAHADAFLAGYASLRALPDRDTLAWYTAASLLVERALGVVHRLRAEGLAHLEPLLVEGLSLIDR